VHAEQNAVIQAAYFGVSIKDATIYTTTYPCVMCTKILVNAGIREVVYKDDYVDPLSKEILEESGVTVRRHEAPLEIEEP
jgi:dCMP deaminase